eukprot:2409918-Alexandrium_andersonii.AAC.1
MEEASAPRGRNANRACPGHGISGRPGPCGVGAGCQRRRALRRGPQPSELQLKASPTGDSKL